MKDGLRVYLRVLPVDDFESKKFIIVRFYSDTEEETGIPLVHNLIGRTTFYIEKQSPGF